MRLSDCGSRHDSPALAVASLRPLLLLVLLSACGCTEVRTTSQEFTPAPEPTQIPMHVVEDASRRSGGAIDTPAAPAQPQVLQPSVAAQPLVPQPPVAVQPKAPQPSVAAQPLVPQPPVAVQPKAPQPPVAVRPKVSQPPAAVQPRPPPRAVATGPAVVLGALTTRSDDTDVRPVRETIAERISSSGKLRLVDAPEEEFAKNTPRPDLARRGIKFIVKGAVTYGKASGQTTVFLRVVDTSTGHVAVVASGREADPAKAGRAAATTMLEKLGGRL